MSLPRTITEAQAQSGTRVVLGRTDATDSNVRSVPYADYFQDRTALIETPMQRLQREADEAEAAEAAESDSD